jgi:hypothetical protein
MYLIIDGENRLIVTAENKGDKNVNVRTVVAS